MVYYFYKHGDELHRISKIPLNHLLAIIGLIFIGNLVRSAQLRKFINILGSRTAYLQSVWLTVGCTLLNYLPMNIGMIVKARGLKKSLGIRYAHFVSLSSVTILLTMISGACMGLIVLIISWNTIGLERTYTIFFFLVVLTVVLLLFAIPSDWFSKGKWWILKTIGDYLDGVEQIRNKPTDLSILFLFVTGRLLLIAVQFIICFSALGTQISFYGGVLFAVVTSLLMIVNITPAALGVREVLVGAIAATTGQGFEVGVLASGIYRACAVIVHITIGVPGLVMLRVKKII